MAIELAPYAYDPLPDPEKLKALLHVCKDAGIESFRSGDIEIRFGPRAGMPKPPPRTEQQSQRELEDLLMYSAGV